MWTSEQCFSNPTCQTSDTFEHFQKRPKKSRECSCIWPFSYLHLPLPTPKYVPILISLKPSEERRGLTKFEQWLNYKQVKISDKKEQSFGDIVTPFSRSNAKKCCHDVTETFFFIANFYLFMRALFMLFCVPRPFVSHYNQVYSYGYIIFFNFYCEFW